MKIEITGARCATCQKYTQYYQNHYERGFEAIDCGYCGIKSKNVRPGDRCKEYREKSTALWVGAVGTTAREKEK